MGGAAARSASKLGMKVIGVRRTPGRHRHADEILPLAKLHKGLARADFVLIAAPLTPATAHLIDAAAIAAMKDGAGLINVGRAGVVDYDALTAALKDGKLSGAILDVFDPEPLPASSPLWQVPNLIITPHCSSDDLDDYLPRTMDLAFENFARLTAGRRLKNVVDRRLGY
jgi:phosphoglycerate dehydrogenase-like enzyme